MLTIIILPVFGRTEERIARIQESYITQTTSSWLESLERSLTQMKDYQVSRTVATAGWQ
jgi:hypothetical protein